MHWKLNYDYIIQLLYEPIPGEHLKYSHNCAKNMPLVYEHTNLFWLQCYNICTVSKNSQIVSLLSLYYIYQFLFCSECSIKKKITEPTCNCYGERKFSRVCELAMALQRTWRRKKRRW